MMMDTMIDNKTAFINGETQDKETIDNYDFPDNCEKIIIHKYFSIDSIKLPKSLKKLVFGSGINQPIDHIIFPDTLEELVLGAGFNQSLNKLNIKNWENFTLRLYANESVTIDSLPNNLQNLMIDNIQLPLSNLPIGLKTLKCYDFYSNRDKLEKCKIPFQTKVILI